MSAYVLLVSLASVAAASGPGAQGPGAPASTTQHIVFNRENVEWTGWSPDDAIKIAWRNWGRQIRILPPPKLASPRYTAACRAEVRRLVPVVRDWHAGLRKMSWGGV
jgi:hypothetical protein